MNVFAKFDEISSIILEVIKETKRYGHTFIRTVVRTDNVKTVYPPTYTVCGGYNNADPGLEKKLGLGLHCLLFSCIYWRNTNVYEF